MGFDVFGGFVIYLLLCFKIKKLNDCTMDDDDDEDEDACSVDVFRKKRFLYTYSFVSFLSL